MSVERLKGGEHECAAAGLPLIGDADDCGGTARTGANVTSGVNFIQNQRFEIAPLCGV